MAKVSNARRIGFTALALVAFGVVLWGAHYVADVIWGMTGNVWRFANWGTFFEGQERQMVFFVLLASLLPSIFLSLSKHPRVLASSVMFSVSVVLSYWIAAHNRVPSFALDAWIRTVVVKDHGSLEQELQFAQILAEQHVSVFWLLLPIILTTAFVIFGAWRSAVHASASGGAIKVIRSRAVDRRTGSVRRHGGLRGSDADPPLNPGKE
jgi:hypothetical protein